MNAINELVQGLNDSEFQELINIVGPPHSKFQKLLQLSVDPQIKESRIPNLLGINQGSYYTLKSRLIKKITIHLSTQLKNPEAIIKEEAARITSLVFKNNKEASVRMLKDLEKKLLNYDLSNELALVYKNLSRLNRYNPEYNLYESLYNRHVAFSLAVQRAEDHFLDFIFNYGQYKLSGESKYLKLMDAGVSDLESTLNLYESDRIYILYHQVNIYRNCIKLPIDLLRKHEMEVEEVSDKIRRIILGHPLDNFYQAYKFIPDFILFEYYSNIDNEVRAEYYLNRILPILRESSKLTWWPFHISRFIAGVIRLYQINSKTDFLTRVIYHLERDYRLNPEETYHFLVFERFKAMVSFYTKDYHQAASTISKIRNTLNLRDFQKADLEMKFLQILFFSLAGDFDFAHSLLISVRRQVSALHNFYPSTKSFIKFLQTVIKDAEENDFNRSAASWNEFYSENNKIDDKLLPYLVFSPSDIKVRK